MNKLKSIEREISAILLGVCTAVILWLTLLHREGTIDNPLKYLPLHSFFSFGKDIITKGITGNVLGNILIFIPIGLLFPASFERRNNGEKVRWGKTVLFGFCLSLIIEISQLTFSKGYCEMYDLILNTLGTSIGWVCYRKIQKTIYHKNITDTHNNKCTEGEVIS